MGNSSSSSHKYSEAVRAILIGLSKSKIAEPTRRFIDKLTGYADKPFMLKSLNEVDCRQRDSQKRVRVRMIRVLSTLITYMDWSTFRLGVAKPLELDPVKHTSMRDRYESIYGEKMPESTWYRYIGKLVSAGYLSSQAMDILDKDDGRIKGVACYKWLTMKLFKEIGMKAGWLDAQRNFALERLRSSGLSNVWPVYESKLSKRKRAQALQVEAFQTEISIGEFDTDELYSPPFSYPH
ncbi:hypothetical protein ATY36_13605 [Vibrio cidicii]|uniref:hypothetical protein n=1 Tax=Vibrio cidicii TaxID=1763883 RepID=UPI00077FF81E|nr:hypothetical protein [Vibrio cidicii]KYN82219.1 hypothetical protein ATY36_13605 [Vibrio cidicii]